MSRRISNLQLHHDITALTNLLRSHILPDTCVALQHLPPSLSLSITQALHLLHALPVFLNDRWSSSETQIALSTLSPSLIITTTRPCHHLKACLPKALILTNVQDQIHIEPFSCFGTTTSISITSLPPDTAVIFFTSGTTGAPKPVPLTQQNLRVQSLAKIHHIPYHSSTILLNLAPLFHIGGYSSAHAAMVAKCTQIFPQRTTAQRSTTLLNLIASENVTALVLVPAILQQLVDTADTSYPTVSRILYGGNPMSRRLRLAAAITFPNAQIVGAYGMTETASSITFLHHSQLKSDSPLHASAGKCPDHVQVEIRSKRHVMWRGEMCSVGDIYTRGPHVMPGYFSDTSSVHDGWFGTGDVGYLHDGYLHIVGRSKDMIKSGGENVFCQEVEEALIGHIAVREAAVLGIPHRLLGEAVAAAVVFMSGTNDGVLDQLRDSLDCLSPFKRPKWIVPLESLPRNASGKVLKQQLRPQLESRIYARLSRL